MTAPDHVIKPLKNFLRVRGASIHDISNGESSDLSKQGLNALSVQVRNGAFRAKLK